MMYKIVVVLFYFSAFKFSVIKFSKNIEKQPIKFENMLKKKLNRKDLPEMHQINEDKLKCYFWEGFLVKNCFNWSIMK